MNGATQRTELPVERWFIVTNRPNQNFGYAGSVVHRNLDCPVVVGCTGGKNLSEPGRCAAQSALTEFMDFTRDEEVGLHDSIDSVIRLVALGEPHVQRGNEDSPRRAHKLVSDLARDLNDCCLMPIRWRWWLSDMGRAINQLIAMSSRPDQVVGERVMQTISLGYSHGSILCRPSTTCNDD